VKEFHLARINIDLDDVRYENSACTLQRCKTLTLPIVLSTGDKGNKISLLMISETAIFKASVRESFGGMVNGGTWPG